MTYLDALREHGKTDTATELQLRSSAQNEKIKAVLVVEGEEDRDLYTYAFDNIVSDDSVETIICKGKGGVLGLRNFSAAHFPNDKKVMFFIDRDHDDFLERDHGDERTYVTDHYSIEWDICTEEVLIKLVARHYILRQIDPIRDLIRKKFRELMKSWTDHSRPIMQAVVLARLNREDLELDKIMLSDICRLKENSFERTENTIEDLLKKAGSENCPSDEELAQCSRELYDCDVRLYIRGKLAVQFFCKFFQELKQICGDPKKLDGSSLATKAQIGKNSYIEFILEDWDPPETLRKFFADWKERQAA